MLSSYHVLLSDFRHCYVQYDDNDDRFLRV